MTISENTIKQFALTGTDLIVTKKILDQWTPELARAILNQARMGAVRGVVNILDPSLTVVQEGKPECSSECSVVDEHEHWGQQYRLVPSELLQESFNDHQ